MTAPSGPVVRYLIVGAGPGGLQLSHYLDRAGADYLTLERATAPGSFFTRYPRHRKLISLNKVNTVEDDPEIKLRWDWNSLLNDDPALLFPEFSGDYFPHADDLVAYLAAFQERYALNVRYGTEVRRVAKEGGLFAVETNTGVVHAECLIVATGFAGPNIPAIPGIELATGYEDLSTFGTDYTGKRVLVVGKGNSAFETAAAVFPHAAVVHLASPRPVKLAWTTKHPGDVRGQYGAFLDSYWFKTLHAVLECDVDRIRREGEVFKVDITYTLAEGETAELEYDAVLRCTGFTMGDGPFTGDCVPERVPSGRLPAIRPDFQSTNVDGLYFAGTLMQARDFKRASSAFIDGFRYNLRTLAALLTERYDGKALPEHPVPAGPGALTGAILDRVNHSSALWTQFEYLCDAYVVDGGDAVRYEDLPEDLAVERFADRPLVLTVTLRWGPRDRSDVFDIARRPSPEHADECAFLHPVVKAWRYGEPAGERHLLEDLMAVWRDPVRHVEPLRAFLAETLRGS